MGRIGALYENKLAVGRRNPWTKTTILKSSEGVGLEQWSFQPIGASKSPICVVDPECQADFAVLPLELLEPWRPAIGPIVRVFELYLEK